MGFFFYDQIKPNRQTKNKKTLEDNVLRELNFGIEGCRAQCCLLQKRPPDVYIISVTPAYCDRGHPYNN